MLSKVSIEAIREELKKRDVYLSQNEARKLIRKVEEQYGPRSFYGLRIQESVDWIEEMLIDKVI